MFSRYFYRTSWSESSVTGIKAPPRWGSPGEIKGYCLWLWNLPQKARSNYEMASLTISESEMPAICSYSSLKSISQSWWCLYHHKQPSVTVRATGDAVLVSSRCTCLQVVLLMKSFQTLFPCSWLITGGAHSTVSRLMSRKLPLDWSALFCRWGKGLQPGVLAGTALEIARVRSESDTKTYNINTLLITWNAHI